LQAGEALGAIGSAEVLDVLREYAKDPQTEVHVHLSKAVIELVIIIIIIIIIMSLFIPEKKLIS